MMTMEVITRYVTAKPFRPFRIKMTSGETFDIRHPEMIQAGITTATIFTWMSADNNESMERERQISMILIESIEPIETSVKQDQS